ncbi:ferredoxin [Embleya sp. AB8]|uniref:ferredoxin n=1 Tax=Embleya sp. AB8 TaxID=3156304 RepID=UPI003C734F3F
MHVSADRTVCVGAGLCALTAPEVFDQDDDGLVTVLTPTPTEKGRRATRQAANLCPSRAIRVTDE